MNVLIVDDDDLSRRAARRVLRTFAVDEAGDETAALSAVAGKAYDAVVIDVCLHGGGDQSGVVLARRLRSTGQIRAIVLISGVAADLLPALAQAAGADAWLAKGSAPGSALRECVERCLLPQGDASDGDRFGVPATVQPLIDDFLLAAAQEDVARGERSFRLALLARAVAGPSAQTSVTRSVAQAVGVSVELLRQYAFVANRWPEAELHELLIGGRTSISHLKEIAAMPLEQRRSWTTRLLESPTTVRELQGKVRKGD